MRRLRIILFFVVIVLFLGILYADNQVTSSRVVGHITIIVEEERIYKLIYEKTYPRKVLYEERIVDQKTYLDYVFRKEE